MALREEVSAVDELDMATTRLRVRLPDEPRPEIPQPNVLESTEVCFFLRTIPEKFTFNHSLLWVTFFHFIETNSNEGQLGFAI